MSDEPSGAESKGVNCGFGGGIEIQQHLMRQAPPALLLLAMLGLPRTSEAVVRFRRFGPSDREQDFSVGLYLALPFHEASGR